jgi:C4-dicarboxylate-specific signal transduction histidine kinase
MSVIIYSSLIERTKIFLKELLKIRSELQVAKTVLEIKVKARTEELEELTKTLDQKVGQRTQEVEESKKILEKRVDELERLHNLTVGRELKMLELKKEIKILKEKK